MTAGFALPDPSCVYSVTALRRGGRRRRNEPSAQFASLIAPYAGCAGTCAVLSRSGPVQSLLSNYLDQILALPFTSSQARKDKPRRGSPGMFAGPDRLAFGHPLVRQGCHVGQVSAWVPLAPPTLTAATTLRTSADESHQDGGPSPGRSHAVPWLARLPQPRIVPCRGTPSATPVVRLILRADWMSWG